MPVFHCLLKLAIVVRFTLLIVRYLALTDKAGGKKFSRDFEEGSAQLQDFVKFFEKQSKVGPPLLEALTNADIFYEMQYKEVKIVANVSDAMFNILTLCHP